MSIRMATVADIPQILQIYGPYVENTAISFEYTVPTVPEFTQRFLTITDRFAWLVWEEEGQLLGYAYGSLPFERAAFQWCAEVSVYLRPQARGRGIGRQLYQVLEALLTLQGYVKVYSLITTANEPSLRFHQAVGYTHTAQMPACGFKLGRWHGLVWMEKQLKLVELPTEAPAKLKDIVDIERKFQQILDNLPLSPEKKI